MGLVDKVKRVVFGMSDANPDRPAAAHFKCAPGTIYAPVTGLAVTLDEVHDEAIAKGLFGEGIGIIPEVGMVYAPVSGRIGTTTVTNHAIELSTRSGITVLIHVGIDTVEMNGDGFTRFVESNEEVRAGEPLIAFDIEAIKAAGHDDVVTCVVSNSENFESVEDISASGTTIAGHPLVKVGDPILFVNER